MLRINFSGAKIMSEPAEEPAGWAGRKMVKYERAIRRNFDGVKIASEPTANQSGGLAITRQF